MNIYTVSYVFILLFFSALTIIYRFREKNKPLDGYVLLYVLQRSRNIMVLNKIKKRYARMYQKHNLQSNKATKLTKKKQQQKVNAFTNIHILYMRIYKLRYFNSFS